jgi:hypothetical protein
MAEEARNNLCSLVNGTCRGNSQNLFYSGNNDTFSDSTTPNTKYYSGTSTNFGLSSISTPGTTMSALYSYSTPTVPVTIFSDGFEATGWNYTQVTGVSASWYYYSSSEYPSGITPRSGSYMAGFNSYTASAGDQALLSSAAGIAIPASYDTVAISFWMYHDTEYTNSDSVQVQISTNSGSTWANLGSPVYRYDGTNGWAKVALDLSSYKGQSNILIGFLGTSAWGNDIYIDDLTIGGYFTNKALIGTTNYYQSLTDAYAGASSGNIIKARSVDFVEDLLCSQSKNITLDGGYDSGYLNHTGYSVLRGKLTVRGGSVTMSRLIIR